MGRSAAGVSAVGDGEVESWIESYNAVMSRGGAEGSGKKPGPGCCSICCTGFSIFAALFLFVLAGAMKSHYPYMHVHGAWQAREERRGGGGGGGPRGAGTGEHTRGGSEPLLAPSALR